VTRRKIRRLPGVVVVCLVGFVLLWASAAPTWLLGLSVAVFVSLCWIVSRQDAARK
jgi:uncharacterized membrane protein YgaE (UPF0421/DUF939 family)